MINESTVVIKKEKDNITRIILNEPETYNALSLHTIKLLIESFNKLNNDKKTRVIIIEGKGKGFSAGHNLKEVRLLKGKPEYKKLFILCSKLMISITNNSKPVINLVLALNVKAATIIKIIHIASVIAIEAKKLLTTRKVFIYLK